VTVSVGPSLRRLDPQTDAVELDQTGVVAGGEGNPELQDREMDNVVFVESDSPDDNFITNLTDQDVSVACKSMWGASQFSLRPGETTRMTFGVSAGAFPLGEYSYDDLKYDVGEGDKWEVRSEDGQLVMVNVGRWASEAETRPENTTAPAAWYADPSGRHQFRYWDGADWTPSVADDGRTSVDAL